MEIWINIFREYVFIDDDNNLINKIWAEERPKRHNNKVIILSEKYSGMSTKIKYKIIADYLININSKSQVDESIKNRPIKLYISNLDKIAWITNLRGSDIKYNPVFFAFAIFTIKDNKYYLDLYSEQEKFDTEEIKKYLEENNITIKPVNQLYTDLESFIDYNIYSCCNDVSYKISNLTDKNKNFFVMKVDFLESIKNIKNKIEIEGFRKANIKDSVALIKLFAWIEDQLINKKRQDLNEYEVGLKALEFRQLDKSFVSESCHPICGYGPNGAIIHYNQSEIHNSLVGLKSMLLIDSGGHYYEGTTDITRTLHFGTPTDYEKEIYTRVLLGNLSLERYIFSPNTDMESFEVVAKKYLMHIGLDYLHGTSHGVGHFLFIHEGNYENYTQVGHIQTNEPGCYLEGQFGVRIENENLVIQVDDKLGFENITPLPYERKLIDLKAERESLFLNYCLLSGSWPLLQLRRLAG